MQHKYMAGGSEGASGFSSGLAGAARRVLHFLYTVLEAAASSPVLFFALMTGFLFLQSEAEKVSFVLHVDGHSDMAIDNSYLEEGMRRFPNVWGGDDMCYPDMFNINTCLFNMHTTSNYRAMSYWIAHAWNGTKPLVVLEEMCQQFSKADFGVVEFSKKGINDLLLLLLMNYYHLLFPGVQDLDDLVLSIFDALKEGIEKRIPFKHLSRVLRPSWPGLTVVHTNGTNSHLGSLKMLGRPDFNVTQIIYEPQVYCLFYYFGEELERLAELFAKEFYRVGQDNVPLEFRQYVGRLTSIASNITRYGAMLRDTIYQPRALHGAMTELMPDASPDEVDIIAVRGAAHAPNLHCVDRALMFMRFVDSAGYLGQY